jgi:hypothetical protein
VDILNEKDVEGVTVAFLSGHYHPGGNNRLFSLQLFESQTYFVQILSPLENY